jgi:hypothetical protein
MRVTGSAADVKTFMKMMREGASGSPSFSKLIREIASDTDPAHCVQVNVGRSQPGVVLDEYSDNDVDLDDLEQLARAPGPGSKNTMTRYEDIAHFLAERRSALLHGALAGDRAAFLAAHQVGLAQENAYRAERHQSPVVALEANPRPDGTKQAVVRFKDRTRELWNVDDTGKLTKA